MIYSRVPPWLWWIEKSEWHVINKKVEIVILRLLRNIWCMFSLIIGCTCVPSGSSQTWWGLPLNRNTFDSIEGQYLKTNKVHSVALCIIKTRFVYMIRQSRKTLLQWHGQNCLERPPLPGSPRPPKRQVPQYPYVSRPTWWFVLINIVRFALMLREDFKGV